MKAHVASAHPEGSEAGALDMYDSASDADSSDVDDVLSEDFESDEDEAMHRSRVPTLMMKAKSK